MQRCPDGLFIFLLPPTLAELEQRIRGRGSETEETLARRLGNAKKEIQIGLRYKYVVVNDEVELAVGRIKSILTAEHCRVDLNTDLFEVLEDEKR